MKLSVMIPLLQLKYDYVADFSTNIDHLVYEFNYKLSISVNWGIINYVCRCWEYKDL